MKVVGLISGGKDSIFNLMKCVEMGHELVAVANIEPSQLGVEELDSYMYQTVGHGAVEAVAECLELPLFRHQTTGCSISKEMDYVTTEGDEVEDLYALLKTVVESYPDVQGVSSGAVFSDYQRIRVENVCDRLGLKSLAYLWHIDQGVLLDEMRDAHLDAILVKVACIGLTPVKHLGKSVHSMRDDLTKMQKQYGINVAGEGGEYETLTVDCPLYKHKKILINEEDCTRVVTDDDDTVAVGHLLIKRVNVIEKIQGTL